MHLGIRVVGDGDVAAAHEGGRRAGPEVRLARLEPRAAIVLLAPRNDRFTPCSRIEAVEGVVRHDEYTPRLVDREGVADRFGRELQARDLSAVRLHGADEAVHRHEPESPRPVGQRGDDALGDRHHSREVVHADELEAGPRRTIGLAHDPDLSVIRRGHHPVELVEVEVAASREIAEHGAAPAAGPRREREGGLRVEGLGIDHGQHRSLDTDTDGDHPPLAVERQGATLGVLQGRADLGRAAERSRPDVGVGLVRIVVDVAPPVRGHERVLGHAERAHALRHRRRTDEGGYRIGSRILGDRDGRLAGDRPRRESQGGERRANRNVHAAGTRRVEGASCNPVEG